MLWIKNVSTAVTGMKNVLLHGSNRVNLKVAILKKSNTKMFNRVTQEAEVMCTYFTCYVSQL